MGGNEAVRFRSGFAATSTFPATSAKPGRAATVPQSRRDYSQPRHPEIVRARATPSDEARILERIEVGSSPGNTFELVGPHARSFFDPRRTPAAIVPGGGPCPVLNDLIRSPVFELHHGMAVARRARLPSVVIPGWTRRAPSSQRRGHALADAGVPKTIDDDVQLVSRTFGDRDDGACALRRGNERTSRSHFERGASQEVLSVRSAVSISHAR